MRIAGFDIATNVGIGLLIGEQFSAIKWHPKAKRPFALGAQAIDSGYESEICEEWRDFVRSFLIEHAITAVAFEKPRTADFGRTRIEIDLAESAAGKAFRKVKERGSSNLSMVRGVMMCATLCGIARRLNIPFHQVSDGDWRESFLGFARAPKGTTDGRSYLKAASINRCKQIGIDVGQNDNKADGVGVCWWLRGAVNPYGARIERDLLQSGWGGR